MNLRTKQAGFSVFELFLVVAVVAILGLAGYVVHNRRNTIANTTSSSQTSANSLAPVISSASDLDKALTVLDRNDPGTANASDTTDLNSELTAF